ncbi:MAG: glycosyltransferase family 2 protein [Deltaproteobacteria bacterium]|nr:glycosyltransferase family 2 protein [Deltaproteobacteria bacterium]
MLVENNKNNQFNHRLFRKKFPFVFSPESYKTDKNSELHCFDSEEVKFCPSGWVIVTGDIPLIEQLVSLKLSLNFGLGFEEAEFYSLNYLNRSLIPTVINLPENIKKIRLEIEGEGVNRKQTILNITPIFKFESLMRIVCYIYCLNKRRGISTFQLIKDKWYQIRKLGALNVIKYLSRSYHYGNTRRSLSYLQWIQRNERIDHLTRKKILSSTFKLIPDISIICRATADINLLKSTVESFREQVYTNWHLIVVIDKKSEADTCKWLETYIQGDKRVTVHDADLINQGELVMKTLSLMNGEFGLWIAAGDRLSRLGLYYLVEAINRVPDVIVWYCDSDQLNVLGKRCNPCFRPDWNRELFYSQNYVGNTCLFHIPAIKKCCEAGKLVDDAEFFDLLLHLLEHAREEQIGHVDRVLYHHYEGQFSKKGTFQEKAGRQRIALKNHFQRLGKKIQVEPGLLAFTHKIDYPLPEQLPRISIIIPTRDHVTILTKCINSILDRTAYSNYNIIVVNNGSQHSRTFSYFSEISKIERIQVIDYNKAFNFAKINNFAVKQTDAEIICLLNNDIEVISAKWLEEMAGYVVQPEIGCVGAKLLYSDGTIQHAGVICGLGDVAGHAHRYFKRDEPGYFGRIQSAQYFSVVTAACLLVRREAYIKAGGMNEQLAVAYNDVDFCLRIKKAGYKNVYTPYAELYHHEYLSRGAEDNPVKRKRYQKEVDYMWATWKKELENDNSYNSGLSRLREDFSMNEF